MNRIPKATAALVLAIGGSAAFAQATITHDKALAGSVTPGDAAGYPVTISQPGSYKLMSNLHVPAGLDGVIIASEGVSLDLNGFSVIGAATCTRTPATKVVTCSNMAPGASGVVLQAIGSQLRNGSVRGFGFGVRSFGAAGGEKLLLTQNRYGLGIHAVNSPMQGMASNWSDVIVTHSELVGVIVNFGSVRLSGFNASRNGQAGIAVTASNESLLVENSVLADNAGFGLANNSSPSAVAVRGSQVIRNGNGAAASQIEAVTNLGGNQFQ